jgi:hypothetical protein
MRIIKTLLLLSIFCLTACQTQFKNVRSFDIKHKMCKAFVVVRQDWNYPLGFIDQEDRLTLIQADLDTLGQIETIWPSPSGQRVIIESYGEGHQFITVYDVSVLIERYDQSKMIEPISTLDPYPYAFDNIKWIDDDRIQFSSPSDFTVFDKGLRRGKYSPDEDDKIERIWQYNIKTDTFREMKSQQ